MPNVLKPDARCPKCQKPLAGAARMANVDRGWTILIYMHAEGGENCRLNGDSEEMDKIHKSLHEEVPDGGAGSEDPA